MNSKILKSTCDKHGDIIDTTLTIGQKDGNIYKMRHYCIHCIADILDRLHEQYKAPNITVTKEVVKQNLKDPKIG